MLLILLLARKDTPVLISLRMELLKKEELAGLVLLTVINAIQMVLVNVTPMTVLWDMFRLLAPLTAPTVLEDALNAVLVISEYVNFVQMEVTM